NYNIELLKKDDKDKVLEGAEFTLFTEDGNEVEKQTTDADGNITFKNVEPGNYYIQETKAPKGYELDSTQHPVEITEKQREPIELEISNNPIKTYVSVEKVWKGSEEESVTINL